MVQENQEDYENKNYHLYIIPHVLEMVNIQHTTNIQNEKDIFHKDIHKQFLNRDS